jgi:hypothetical protein
VFGSARSSVKLSFSSMSENTGKSFHVAWESAVDHPGGRAFKREIASSLALTHPIYATFASSPPFAAAAREKEGLLSSFFSSPYTV